MRRLLNRFLESEWGLALYFIGPPAFLVICLVAASMAAGALLFGCTPPRTVEHAPDIATASPPTIRSSRTVAEAAADFAALAIGNLAAPVRPAAGWPHGAVTWRPDWSLGRATGSYDYVMHRSVCDTSMPQPTLTHGHREPVVGEQVQVQALTASLAAPSDWPAVLLMEPDGAGLDGDLSPFGLTGCRLAVDLSRATMLWPGSDPANLLFRAPGTARLHLNWTPTDEWAGRSVVCQLLVFVPRVIAASGMIVSGGLRITVGRK